MQNYRDQFNSIMTIILDPKSNKDELTKAIHSMDNIYSEIIDQETLSILSGIERMQTPHGLAFSPLNVINCLTDVWRTSKYQRGICTAILEFKKRFPKEPLHIVYAGTGPYATLLIPILMTINTQNLKFTFIDINQESLDLVSFIIKQLDLSHVDLELVCGDASSMTFDSPAHLVITETMTAALEMEGQVAISYNLGKQMKPNGILIPQEIQINAILADPQNEFHQTERAFRKDRRIHLGRIFNLNLHQILQNKNEGVPERLPASSIQIPKEIPVQYQLMLTTEIKIWKDIVIEEYESGLTLPFIYSLENGDKNDFVVEFYYNTIGIPGFKNHPILEEINS